MIKGLVVIGVAAALGLAGLPIEVSAKGIGGHGFHAGHHHRAFAYGPYGGLVITGKAIGSEPVGYVSTSQPLGPVIPPTFVLQCHHSVETVTVPSEEGGTREITIRRC